MGLREILKKAFEKKQEKKEEFKTLERQMRMQKIIEDRLTKSANERELERYYNEEKEKRIKAKLIQFHKKRNNEFWHGNPILKQKNMFMGHENILNQHNIFKMENTNLRGNLFI